MPATFKIPDIGAVPPWEVLPREPTGDATQEAIFQAVGRALSAWELLDTQQADLFGQIVGSRARGAEAAYGTVTASQGRTAMILAAADRAFTQSAPALLGDLKLFVERIGKLAGRRNEIAHGLVSGFTQNDKFLGHYLIPAFYNTRKHFTQTQLQERFSKITSMNEFTEEFMVDPFRFGPNKYAYTSSQIMVYAEHFVVYKNSTIELVQVVKDTCAELFP